MTNEFTIPEIDIDNLDGELMEIGSQIGFNGEKQAESERNMLRKEEFVKTLRSELILEANEDTSWLPKGVKLTDSKVEAYYRTSEDYIEAKSKWIKAKYFFEKRRAIVFGLHAKKQALENLVKLTGIDYFSTPVANKINRRLNGGEE